MVLAHETGLTGRIEFVPTSPAADEATLVLDNPLGKVPALVTDDGIALYDSPVICEYLDSLHGGPPVFPAAGVARWTALRRQALADGILDATVLCFVEGLRKPERRSQGWISHNRAAVARAVDALEGEAASLADPRARPDIGAIAIGIALDFIGMHFPDYGWRETHPRLAAWHLEFRARPSMQATVPVHACDVA
jgi:glutathione S-transferase